MSFFVYIHLFTPVIRSDHWSEKVCLLKWKDLTTGVVRLYLLGTYKKEDVPVGTSPFIYLVYFFNTTSELRAQCKQQLMTGIFHFCCRKVNIIKRIEIRLVHIVLISNIRINYTTTIT